MSAIYYLVLVPFALFVGFIIRGFTRYNLNKLRIKSADKPLVLYLRAFDFDKQGVEFEPSLVNPFPIKGFPFETSIARAVFKIGHGVAVGIPGEEIPDSGFERIYFKDQEWKEKVLDLIEKSVMVIYRPDSSAGVFWEIDQLLHLSYQNKTVIWTGDLLGNNILQKAKYDVLKRKIFENYHIIIPLYNEYKSFLAYSENEWKLYASITLTPIYQLVKNDTIPEKV